MTTTDAGPHGPGCNCPLVDVGASPVYVVAIRACRA